jgi:hypothetical protein
MSAWKLFSLVSAAAVVPICDGKDYGPPAIANPMRVMPKQLGHHTIIATSSTAAGLNLREFAKWAPL